MTFRTLAALWPGVELAAVNILVAVLAIGKGQGLFEIAAGMTCDTGNLGVPPEEREFSLGVVKFELR